RRDRAQPRRRPARRYRPAHRRERGRRDDEADRGAADDAQLRGLHPVSVLVILGPPGAGKGTQAVMLAERLGVPHIATGDLFRAAVAARTPIGREVAQYMGRGELVPDEITLQVLLERLRQRDAAAGAVLDGFPRNRRQAEALDAALAERGLRVDRAVMIEVPAEDLIRRLAGRWQCRAGG